MEFTDDFCWSGSFASLSDEHNSMCNDWCDHDASFRTAAKLDWCHFAALRIFIVFIII